MERMAVGENILSIPGESRRGHSNSEKMGSSGLFFSALPSPLLMSNDGNVSLLQHCLDLGFWEGSMLPYIYILSNSHSCISPHGD